MVPALPANPWPGRVEQTLAEIRTRMPGRLGTQLDSKHSGPSNQCYADVMDAPQAQHKVTSRSYDIHG